MAVSCPINSKCISQCLDIQKEEWNEITIVVLCLVRGVVMSCELSGWFGRFRHPSPGVYGCEILGAGCTIYWAASLISPSRFLTETQIAIAQGLQSCHCIEWLQC